MKKIRTAAAAIALAIMGFTATSHAIIGIGVHYGMDFSLNMKDLLNDPATFDSLKLTADPLWGAGAAPITGADIPIFIDRTGFKRTAFDIGGKLYIDIIPVLDAIELSGNFGLWEYEGSLRYPKTISPNTSPTGTKFKDLVNIGYDTMPMTLKNFGIGYLGINGTPYVKFNADLTIRKYILKIPKSLKTLRIYAGGGVSVIFATPIVSSGLIADALGDKVNREYSLTNMDQNLFGDVDVMKEVGTEILSRLFTPNYGMHLDLGTMVKIPVIPLGVYVDGKFMIPFGKLDKNVDVGGMGLLLNGGVVLHF